ncbi:LysR family transcriptional regulator [Chitinibacter tainanensis]|uniref:LysR family transcriptional regulator n=1 Tax=Chitinibacter tainanensis TaxID=230667 RepID=UPI00041CB4D0|nr:LysR family transcriptional regulator [Chitinibacter tainanensis]
MKFLRELELLLCTAAAGSLSQAARQLDLSPAVASAMLKRLEAELGVPLLTRSTRHLRLTPAGELFLGHARQAVEEIRAGQLALQAGQQQIAGVLQLSVPSDLGRNVLLPWLDEFLARHPAVELRLELTDRLTNIYRSPVDVAIRYGEPADSGLVALPLAAHNRRVLCAAPAYVAAHGAPASPAEISAHACLSFQLGEQTHPRWRFYRGTESAQVQIAARRFSADGDVVRRWALAGHGLAYKSWLDVAADLAAGRLLPLLTDWQGELAPLYLVCADRRQLSPLVQALRQHLQSCCAAYAGV